MIDGIKLNAKIEDFSAWKHATGIDFYTLMNPDTGNLKDWAQDDGYTISVTKHEGNLNGYGLYVTEVKRESKGSVMPLNYLTLRGSLHKNYFGNENHSRFTWMDLQSEISRVSKKLLLAETASRLTNLEIGLNIEVPFSVYKFLEDNLISFKGKPFNFYDPKDGFSLGFYCPLSHYKVKIYDKGDQYRLRKNLMRFEVHFTKMQTLNRFGIKHLSDLRDREKIFSLKTLLLNTWHGVLLCDDTISLDKPGLKPKEIQLLLDGKNPKFWQQLKRTSKSMYSSKKNSYKRLVRLHGQDMHGLVAKMLEEEWDSLFIEPS